MAPTPIKSSVTSSPISRRTQRRRQRQSKRICEIQKDTAWWSQGKDADGNEHRRGGREDVKRAVATPSSSSRDNKFNARPMQEGELSQTKQDEHKQATLPANSNPFSLLDITPPPSTLPASTACSNPVSHTHSASESSTHNESIVAAQKCPTSLPKLSTKRLCQTPLQSNTASTDARKPLLDGLVLPNKTTIRIPPSEKHILPNSTQHTEHAAQDTHQEPPLSRIPSPLLYHRRSEGICIDPAQDSRDLRRIYDPQRSQATLQKSIIRNVVQKEACSRARQSPLFVAARLPLMGDRSTREGSEDGGVSIRECSPETPWSPRTTSSNTNIFPQNLYNIIQCPRLSTWNNTSTCTIPSEYSLSFPKLDFSCHRADRDPSSSCTTRINGIHQPAELDCTEVATNSNNRPTSLLGVARPRDRSSTQDSLDRSFNVATATLRDDVESSQHSIDDDTVSKISDLTVQAESSILELPVNELTCALESQTDMCLSVMQTANDICIPLDLVDIERSMHSSQPEGGHKDERKNTAPTAADNAQICAKLSLMDAGEDQCTSIIGTGYACDDLDSEVVIAVGDTMLDSECWLWEDDQWESASTSSAGDLNEQL